MWWDSRLPGTYNVMEYGEARPRRRRGVPRAPRRSGQRRSASPMLHGPREGEPDARFTLTARRATIELASGRTVDALTFDGRSPGPELRVTQGDLVEVTLAERGHRPGRDDPLARGRRPECRGRRRGRDAGRGRARRALRLPLPRRAGRDVLVPHASGLLEGGAARALRDARDRAGGDRGGRTRSTARSWRTPSTGSRPSGRIPASSGSTCARAGCVRLRLVNTDNSLRRFALTGTPFQVVAIDGTDLNAPEPIRDTVLEVAGGGRIDVAFTAPGVAGLALASRHERRAGAERGGSRAAARARRSYPSSSRRPTAAPRRRRSASTPSSTAASSSRSRRSPGSSTAARGCSGRSTGGSSPTCRPSSSRRETSSRSRSRTRPTATTRCTCTATTCSC